MTPGKVSTSISCSDARWVGKVAHLGLGKVNVVNRLGGQARDDGGNLLGRKPEMRGRPVVETGRQITHRGIAVSFNLNDNAFDYFPHLSISSTDGSLIDTLL